MATEPGEGEARELGAPTSPMRADVTADDQPDVIPVERGRAALVVFVIAAIALLSWSSYRAWPTTPSVDDRAGVAGGTPQGAVKRAPPSVREIRATAILPEPEPPLEQPPEQSPQPNQAPQQESDDRASPPAH